LQWTKHSLSCLFCRMRNSTFSMNLEIHKQILNHNNLATIIQSCQRVTIYDLSFNHFLVMNHKIFIFHAQRQKSHMFSKWSLLAQVNWRASNCVIKGIIHRVVIFIFVCETCMFIGIRGQQTTKSKVQPSDVEHPRLFV
jgi:hypothetical protein